MSEPASPIRLTVLCGRPGAGKTTWLRRQLRDGVFKDAFVIANTTGDEILLPQAKRLALVSSGCVCCAGKSGLIAVLKDLCSEPAARAHDRIVLETSGLAEPAPIVEAIRADPLLASRIVVSEVIVAVDGGKALDLSSTGAPERRLVAAADCLIVTKVDASEPKALQRLVARLRSVNPTAPIYGAAQCAEAALSPSAPALDPEAVAAAIEIDETIDWTALGLWLSALLHARGDDIVSVSGVVRTPVGRLRIQTRDGIMQRPEFVPEEAAAESEPDNRLVIIGRGYRAEDLQLSLHYFARRPADLS